MLKKDRRNPFGGEREGISGDFFAVRWVDSPAAAFNTRFGNRVMHLLIKEKGTEESWAWVADGWAGLLLGICRTSLASSEFPRCDFVGTFHVRSGKSKDFSGSPSRVIIEARESYRERSSTPTVELLHFSILCDS